MREDWFQAVDRQTETQFLTDFLEEKKKMLPSSGHLELLQTGRLKTSSLVGKKCDTEFIFFLSKKLLSEVFIV